MKIIVVVGCSGLLGAEILQELTKSSDNLIIGFDRKKPELEFCKNFIFVEGLIEDKSDVRRLDEVIKSEQELHNLEGELSAIVNCFVAPDFKFQLDFVPIDLSEIDRALWGWRNYPSDDFERQLHTNVVGIHTILQALFERYKKSNSCSIVNFSSQFAERVPGRDIFAGEAQFIFKPPAYSASKAAVENYTRWLSSLFSGLGIRVNCIAPGVVKNGQSSGFQNRYSSMVNSQRLMRPEEIRGPINFLISRESEYMNGACLAFDGGWTAQ
jgi:NAD(P)-dependent dehydrogenase (short-subunit alcohol dehydrogenase family)